MEERLRKHYLKEEEFLDEFDSIASVAVKILEGEWQPNYAANDNTRKNQDNFKMQCLVFDSASVYHDKNGFSSAQIILKSSHRRVNVRIRKINGELVGEKIFDKP
jgi:hypothetical protein